MKQPLPENWKDREAYTESKGYGAAGSRKAQIAQNAKRVEGIPPDSILEKAQERTPRTWEDLEKSKVLLSLFRDRNLSGSMVAEEMNKIFQTTTFTRGSCLGRLHALKRKWGEILEARGALES